MDNIANFNEFNDSSTDMDFIFSLDEQKCMAKYGFNEFKKLFSGKLLESEGYVDELLIEKAHSYYEMSMLSEAKPHWFDNEEEIFKIDAETHIILVKNSEAFIIEKKTHDAINEWWSLDDAKKAWNKFSGSVSNYVDKKIDSAKKTIKKTWNAISDGAKKAWEWVKSAASAAVKFLSEMTWVEWASLGIGILSAVMGLLGTVVPGATIIAGILMALNGGIHLYEGWEKWSEAKKQLNTIKDVAEITKDAAAINKALPNVTFGTIFMALGFYDISHGLTEALVNPTAALASGWVKGIALTGGKSWLKEIVHKLEYVLGGFLKDVLTKLGFGAKIAKAGGDLGFTIATSFGSAALSSILGWLWKGLLKGAKGILTGIEFLLDLPGKITEGIKKLEKGATSTIGKIIAKGLSNLVKPMTEGCAKVIEKYIKPFIKKAKNWLDAQIKNYDVCVEALEKHKDEMSTKGHEVPQKKGSPIIKKSKGVEASKKDLKLIEKLPKVNKDLKKETGPGYKVKTKNKISESIDLRYLSSFDGFSPI